MSEPLLGDVQAPGQLVFGFGQRDFDHLFNHFGVGGFSSGLVYILHSEAEVGDRLSNQEF